MSQICAGIERHIQVLAAFHPPQKIVMVYANAPPATSSSKAMAVQVISNVSRSVILRSNAG